MFENGIRDACLAARFDHVHNALRAPGNLVDCWPPASSATPPQKNVRLQKKRTDGFKKNKHKASKKTEGFKKNKAEGFKKNKHKASKKTSFVFFEAICFF